MQHRFQPKHQRQKTTRGEPRENRKKQQKLSNSCKNKNGKKNKITETKRNTRNSDKQRPQGEKEQPETNPRKKKNETALRGQDRTGAFHPSPVHRTTQNRPDTGTLEKQENT